MRIGTDIIEIDRIQEAVARSPRFASKVLTTEELARYETMKENRALEFLAGRFAAKEAYVKALGTGIGRIRFTDMSIANKPSGAPYFAVAPLTAGVQLSISHSDHYATATVLIEQDEASLQAALAQYLTRED